MTEESRVDSPSPKYKLREVDPSDIELLNFINESLAKQRQHELNMQRNYGYVKPILSSLFRGMRLVAIKNRIHWSESWKTVPDFLFEYIVVVLGRDWFISEFEKPFEQRHIIAQWRQKAHEYLLAHQVAGKKIHGIFMNGLTRAYLILAYELFVLDMHEALQLEVVRRLKLPTDFQGALHELFVASTMIKAGFELTFEDEHDKTVKHVEFIAKHRTTGITVAVEAKSRHRLNSLGFKGGSEGGTSKSMNIKPILRKAFGKKPNLPYVIFVDVNLPYSNQSKLRLTDRPWVIEASDVLDSLHHDLGYTLEPYNQIIISNHPHLYNDENIPDTPSEMFSIVSQKPEILCPNNSVFEEIHNAADTYGRVPNYFEEVSPQSE